MEKEHTALEELFHCVLIVLVGKQWHLVMVVQKVTVLGVSYLATLYAHTTITTTKTTRTLARNVGFDAKSYSRMVPRPWYGIPKNKFTLNW